MNKKEIERERKRETRHEWKVREREGRQRMI